MDINPEILRIGDEQLKTIASPVLEFDENLIHLVNKMYNLLKKYQGVGLAAPQLGIAKRILVYGVENNKRYPDAPNIPLNALINPIVLEYSSQQDELFEGCLSVPNIRGPVQRSVTISGYAQDLTGKIVPFQHDGFLARIIQHELDHLNGIIFLQRIQDNSRIVYSKN
jgi:peptide deformylase